MTNDTHPTYIKHYLETKLKVKENKVKLKEVKEVAMKVKEVKEK